MAGIHAKNFDSPDEIRNPEKTRLEFVDLGAVKAARFTLEPGWRWAEHLKPLAGTETCEARHVGAVVSGRLHITHSDGTELEIGPGDAYTIEPGHDAWVVGDEPFQGFEFESKTAETYASS